MNPLLRNKTSKKTDLSVWFWGCPHQNAEVSNGNNAIQDALTQINSGVGFSYDFSICHGDFDSNQSFPTLSEPYASEGVLVSNALSGINGGRSRLYEVAGNHDAGDGNHDWYLKYVDPLGENTADSGVNDSLRPYEKVYMYDTVERGKSWHSYYFIVGKQLFMCVSDRNDLPYPYGRGGSVVAGGHPSGTITLETWNWMQSVILANSNKNIIISTHQNPRNTTIGTGDGDGSTGSFHGTSGIAAGSGSLYSIYDEDLSVADDATTAFLDFFANNTSHTVVLWCAAHTHLNYNETHAGKGRIESVNGVTFLNVGHLTQYHIDGVRVPADPFSHQLLFNKNTVKVKQFLHKVLDGNPIGFYNPNESVINLKV